MINFAKFEIIGRIGEIDARPKVTLLSGSDKQEAQLLPVDGKLEATGSFKVGTGTKAVVAVSKAGKAVASVRFVLK